MTFSEYVTSLKDQYDRKNAAYGSSAHDTFVKFGIVSYLTRLSDKINRLITLTSNPDISCNDESIADTLGDAATYCIMAVADIASLNSNKTYSELVSGLFDIMAEEGGNFNRSANRLIERNGMKNYTAQDAAKNLTKINKVNDIFKTLRLLFLATWFLTEGYKRVSANA